MYSVLFVPYDCHKFVFKGAVKRFPWPSNFVYQKDNSRNTKKKKISPFPAGKKFQIPLTHSHVILFTRLHHLEDVQVILSIHEAGASPTLGSVMRNYHLQIV